MKIKTGYKYRDGEDIGRKMKELCKSCKHYKADFSKGNKVFYGCAARGTKDYKYNTEFARCVHDISKLQDHFEPQNSMECIEEKERLESRIKYMFNEKQSLEMQVEKLKSRLTAINKVPILVPASINKGD